MATKRKVIAKKATITKQMKQQKWVKYYPAPELREMDGDEIPSLKVRSATLDDQIQAQHLSDAPNRLLIRLLKMMRDNKEKEIDYEEFRKQIYFDDLHPKTVQICEIFQRCVVQPKFKIGEVLKLSETHPELVNNVAAFALGVEE